MFSLVQFSNSLLSSASSWRDRGDSVVIVCVFSVKCLFTCLCVCVRVRVCVCVWVWLCMHVYIFTCATIILHCTKVEDTRAREARELRVSYTICSVKILALERAWCRTLDKHSGMAYQFRRVHYVATMRFSIWPSSATSLVQTTHIGVNCAARYEAHRNALLKRSGQKSLARGRTIFASSVAANFVKTRQCIRSEGI